MLSEFLCPSPSLSFTPTRTLPLSPSFFPLSVSIVFDVGSEIVPQINLCDDVFRYMTILDYLSTVWAVGIMVYWCVALDVFISLSLFVFVPGVLRESLSLSVSLVLSLFCLHLCLLSLSLWERGNLALSPNQPQRGCVPVHEYTGLPLHRVGRGDHGLLVCCVWCLYLSVSLCPLALSLILACCVSHFCHSPSLAFTPTQTIPWRSPL